MTVVGRDEVRTMPVAGTADAGSQQATTAAESSIETFVSEDRDISVTLRSGASVTLLMATPSGPAIPDEQLINILTATIEQIAEVYGPTSDQAEGMIIFQIEFTAEGSVADVSVIQNFTGSDVLAEQVISILGEIVIEDCPGRGVKLEFAIEFAPAS